MVRLQTLSVICPCIYRLKMTEREELEFERFAEAMGYTVWKL
jgi:hypothetical protein